MQHLDQYNIEYTQYNAFPILRLITKSITKTNQINDLLVQYDLKLSDIPIIKYNIFYRTFHNTCEKCGYKTNNRTTFEQHDLNEHVSKEEREKRFRFYCKMCDYGTFSKDLYERHNTNNKHKKRIENNK